MTFRGREKQRYKKLKPELWDLCSRVSGVTGSPEVSVEAMQIGSLCD